MNPIGPIYRELKKRDSAFARFNTIITSLKALDEGYSSNNYVRKFLRALHPKSRAKSKKESSDEECSTSRSEDEEYAMVVGDYKKFFKRRGRCGDPNHLVREYPKLPKDKNKRAFVRGSWSDSGEKDDQKTNDKTCLMAQASSEVCSESSYFSDENSSIDDLILDSKYDKLCKMSLKIITKNWRRGEERRKKIREEEENRKEKNEHLPIFMKQTI
ncbi:hypothetical protein Tco_0757383 [Tanacetum coccineum]